MISSPELPRSYHSCHRAHHDKLLGYFLLKLLCTNDIINRIKVKQDSLSFLSEMLIKT